MNEHDPLQEEALHIISEVADNPATNQRLISKRLNMSLGKTNYLLKALAQKGFIKLAYFSKIPSKNKQKAVKYLLTKKGIQAKIELTYHFLKIKEREYEKLKEDYEKALASSKEDGSEARDA